jgi:hypothetical protein
MKENVTRLWLAIRVRRLPSSGAIWMYSPLAAQCAGVSVKNLVSAPVSIGMPYLALISAGTLTNDLAVGVEHLKVDRRTAVDAGRCIAELQRKYIEDRGQLRQDRRHDAGHHRGRQADAAEHRQRRLRRAERAGRLRRPMKRSPQSRRSAASAGWRWTSAFAENLTAATGSSAGKKRCRRFGIKVHDRTLATLRYAVRALRLIGFVMSIRTATG